MAEAKLKYPRGERVFVGYYNRSGELLFILTSKEPAREWYYLYALDGGEFRKLGKAREPPDLLEKYHVEEKMLSP